MLLPGEIPRVTHYEILQKALKLDKKPKYNDMLLGLKKQIESWYNYSIVEAKVKGYIKYYIDEALLYSTGKTPHTRYQLEKPESVE